MLSAKMLTVGGFALATLMCVSVPAQGTKKDSDALAKKPVSLVVNDIDEADLNGLSPLAEGLLLNGLIAQWHASADASNYKLVKEVVDKHIKPDGSLDVSGANAVPLAGSLLTLYRVTLDAKYFKLAQGMYDEALAKFAENNHAAVEEEYALRPFMTAYAATISDNTKMDAAADGVLAKSTPHGTMESAHRMQGEDAWRAAALVDVLQWLPASSKKRELLIAELVRVAPGALKGTPSATTAQVLGGYAVLKGVRLGWLPSSMKAEALQANTGPKSPRPSVRDSAPRASNVSPGAEKLLQSEVQQSATSSIAQEKMVAMDGWFNSQHRKNGLGVPELFHYKWNDDAMSGFAFFGRAFQRYGAQLEVVGRPTAESLKGAGVYLIVSPDIPSKNPHPNYMQSEDVEAIARWVSDGGVLMLMQNDGPNAEFEHFNTLSERFGIHFNAVVKNHVEGDHWEQGRVVIPANVTTVFKDAHVAYMKDTCTIATQPPAMPILRDVLHGSGDVDMAIANYGKGKVYAVVDPWLYNEYTDGQKLPAEYDQFASAKELARWALEQAK